MDAAPGFGGLLFEGDEQVEDLAGFGSAVEQVAGLHQMGLAADPAGLLVDDGGVAEDPEESLVVAVDIADGDDAIDTGEGILREGERHGEQERQEVTEMHDGIASLYSS